MPSNDPQAPYVISGNALSVLTSAFTYWQTNSLARTVSILRQNLPANQPLIDAIAAIAAGPANQLARELAQFQADARTAPSWGSTPLGPTRFTAASVLTPVGYPVGEQPGHSFYRNAADDPSIAALHPVAQGATPVRTGPDGVRLTSDDLYSYLDGYPLKSFYRTSPAQGSRIIWSGGGANGVFVTRMDSVVGNMDLLLQLPAIAGDASLVARVSSLKMQAQAVQNLLLGLKPQIDAIGAYTTNDPPPSWLLTYYPGGTFIQFYTGV